MVDFKPFRGLRPASGRTADVACVPYDVVNRDEARALAEGKPDSLLHVSRPDIDLPDDLPFDSEAAYSQARKAFDRLIGEGVLLLDPEPGYYVYRQRMGAHSQVGVVGLASAEDYWANRIKKHEHTRPDKENDRARSVKTLGAQVGPIFLAFRARLEVKRVLARITERPPEVDITAENDVRHELWQITDGTVALLESAFSRLDALYVADGHHRAAAASRVGRDAGPASAANGILAVAFPHDELRILPYNRVVLDWGTKNPLSFLATLRLHFQITQLEAQRSPLGPGEVTLYMGSRWYSLTGFTPTSDKVAGLDVSLLQDQVLEPLLGIADPRKDKRIDFVGGIRGLGELERWVDEGAAVAFAMWATSIEDLMAIADAGEIMPPKSTWFEPKLRSGLVIHRFERP